MVRIKVQVFCRHKRKIYILFCIFGLIITMLMTIASLYDLCRFKYKFDNWYYKETIDIFSRECYHRLTKDRSGLNDVLYLNGMDEKSIIFQETSCRSTNAGKLKLTFRQVCAIESAAKLNQEFTIHLLVAAPVRPKYTMLLEDQLLFTLLNNYPNVKISHVDIRKYFFGTPVKELIRSQKVENSTYPVIHLNDIIKYVSLWRFGAMYMDLDVIVLKSLDDLEENFGVVGEENKVATGIMRLSKKNGKKWAHRILEMINEKYDGSTWSANGEIAFDRLLKEICNTNSYRNMTSGNCQGFHLYPAVKFYPLDNDKWKLLFEPVTVEEPMRSILINMKNASTIHLWGRNSSKKKFLVKNNVLVNKIFKKYCPVMYNFLPNEGWF